ncbi:MAG: hypothetical protein AAGD18_24515 [Actinomycetota bacterium]
MADVLVRSDEASSPGDLGAEALLRQAAAAGEVCDLVGAEHRTIRGDVISRIAMGQDPDVPKAWRGIRIRGADVRGPIDLSYATVDVPLAFWRCDVHGHVSLDYARIRHLDLERSHLRRGLSARHVNVDGSVLLANRVRIEQGTTLVGARISGDLSCEGSAFIAKRDEHDWAIDLDRMVVTGVFCWSHLWPARDESPEPPIWTEAHGGIRVVDARVGTLRDDISAWPKNRYLLDGFAYGRLDGRDENWAVAMRLDWLQGSEAYRPRQWRPQVVRPPERRLKPARRLLAALGHWWRADRAEVSVPRFRAQPYDALAAAYRQRGLPGGAGDIDASKRRRATSAVRTASLYPDRGGWGRLRDRLKRVRQFLWGVLAGLFTRHGHSPWRTIAALGALVLLGGLLLSVIGRDGFGNATARALGAVAPIVPVSPEAVDEPGTVDRFLPPALTALALLLTVLLVSGLTQRLGR